MSDGTALVMIKKIQTKKPGYNDRVKQEIQIISRNIIMGQVIGSRLLIVHGLILAFVTLDIIASQKEGRVVLKD